MNFNNRNFGKTDVFRHSPFVQFPDDANILPPPPGSEVMITESGDKMVVEGVSGDYMITE
jgi:hypothetical protein